MPLRVDIASGETVLDRVDLRLPGPLPLVLARSYRSGYPGGLFGPGWQHGLDRTLRVEPEQVVYRDGAGRETAFAPVPVGLEAQHPGGLTLQHHADAYVVFASPLVQEVFTKRGGGTLLLDRIEDPSGNRIRLAYASGRLTEVVDSAGRRVRFGGSGSTARDVTVVGPDGKGQPVRTFQYGAGNALVAEADAAGRTVEYAYHDGLLVRITDAAGAVWFAQYDDARRCTALWRGDGTDLRQLAYDALRQTTRVTGLDGRQVIYRHLLGRLVLEAVDSEGESLNFYYDEAQRLIGHSAPGGGVATFQRLDPEKLTYTQIDHESRVLEARCAEAGLIDSIADAFGNAFTLGYDDRFDLVRLTTPLGFVWGFERDRQGRVAAVRSPTGRALRFQRNGQTLSVEDGQGLRLRIGTDALGRVVSRADGLGREQRFRYDPEGNLVGVEAGAYRLLIDYDRGGRLARIADSERNETRWQYDSAGRVLGVEGGGEGGLRFAYDLAGRVMEVAGRSGAVRLQYDTQDRLVRTEGPGGVHLDYADRAVTATGPIGVSAFSLLGDVMEVTGPGQEGRRFEYGPCGELMAVEEEGSSALFEYDPDGRLVRYERGEDVLTLDYDADGLLTRLADVGRAHIEIEHDARGRPTALRAGEAIVRLRFDAGDRLTAVEPGGGPPCVIDYDHLDRITSVRSGGGEPTRIEVGPARGFRMGEEAGPAMRLLAARHGLVVAVRVGALDVPVWGASEVRCRPVGFGGRLVAALALGVEAAVGPAPEDGGLERWRALASAPDALGRDVPTATALGVSWPVLDLFALDRRWHEPSYTERLPGALPQHDAGLAHSPDDAVTGAHRCGPLRPSVWQHRAHGSALAVAAPLSAPLGSGFAMARRLYRELTRPSGP